MKITNETKNTSSFKPYRITLSIGVETPEEDALLKSLKYKAKQDTLQFDELSNFSIEEQDNADEFVCELFKNM